MITRLSRLQAVRRSVRPKGGACLWLRYRAPYDWPAMLAFLAARCIPGIEHCQGEVYRRSFEWCGRPGTVQVSPANGAQLRVELSGVAPGAVAALVARLRRVFDLDAEPARIQAELGRDALMAQLLARRPGLRVAQGWDGFEQAMRTVLGQQVTVAAAMTLAGRLVQRHGQPLALAAAGLSHVFPRASAIAGLTLEGLGMPRARAVTLTTLANALLASPDLLDPGQASHTALERLLKLKGIGPWSAQYLALRQLGDADALPLGDVALIKALQVLEGVEADLAHRAQAWRPWRAYAAQHLWTSLSDLRPPVASQAQ